jgi:hypothetical protein
MSERIHSKHEHNETVHYPENLSDVHKSKHEREHSKEEKEHGTTEHLEAIRSKLEKHVPQRHEALHTEKNHSPQHPVLANKQLKDMAYSRSITRARKKLSAPSRAFSKVIHLSVIESSSEFIGKTAARPVSMLTGAIFAFLGTSTLLWVTKYYGYEYNYLAVILLFIGGAIAGVTVEAMWRLIRKK